MGEYDPKKWDRWCKLTVEQARAMDIDELSDLAASGPPRGERFPRRRDFDSILAYALPAFLWGMVFGAAVMAACVLSAL